MWIGCGNCDSANQDEYVLDWSYGNRSDAILNIAELLEALSAIALQEWSDNERESIETAFSNFWEQEAADAQSEDARETIKQLTLTFKDTELSSAIRSIIES